MSREVGRGAGFPDSRALEEAQALIAQLRDEATTLRRDKERLQEELRFTQTDKERLLGRIQGLEQGMAATQQREQLLAQERDREREMGRVLDASNRDLELRLARLGSELVSEWELCCTHYVDG